MNTRTNANSHFKVLALDDQFYTSIKRPPRGSKLTMLEAIKPTHPLWMFNRLVSEYRDTRAGLDIYISSTADLSAVFRLDPAGLQDEDLFFTDPEQALEFLRSIDVLILDLEGLGALNEKWRLRPEHAPNATKEEFDELASKLTGAGFYLALRQELISCQAVIILSIHDGAPIPALRHLEEFCQENENLEAPWTIKHSKEESSLVADLVLSLYRDFSSGYIQLEQRGAIEFAAIHDEPVLIVGETGTGKEYLAKAIHRRWAQMRQRARPGRRERSDFTVVNCASLLPNLARLELFGHVQGSYTGAERHYVGQILAACGVKAPVNGTGSAYDFKMGLLQMNQDCLRSGGDANSANISFIDKGPHGTLFLDEFGDLPGEVQTQLLRYLETYEVQPLGFPGRIIGARTRIIAATSDPRVARFVNISLNGGWRTQKELNRTLREDLLYRVKGQVLRAQPVDESNAKNIVESLVQRTTSAQWTPSAIDFLIAKVKEQVRSVQQARSALEQGDYNIEAPSFGHRREIARVITLCSAYVKGAHSRGLRGNSDSVTEEVVAKIWAPSLVGLYDRPPNGKGLKVIK